MYLSWGKQTVTDFSDEAVEAMYDRGFVFTRLGKGVMHQTRSLRINLSVFELSSENRRVLRRTSDFGVRSSDIPYRQYDWTIGKMAKDFYDTKFDKGTMSANKVRELVCNKPKSNFNTLFVYVPSQEISDFHRQGGTGRFQISDIGYAICFETDTIVHYAYPFYNLQSKIQNLGIGMMTKAIQWAKEHGTRYVYLGSAQRPTDVYKLQFAGLEWFDGREWKADQKELKNIISKI